MKTVRRRTTGKGVTTSEVFHTAELKGRYERIVARLSEDHERYFDEPGPPVFTPLLSIRRPSSELVKCQVQAAHRSLNLYIKFFLVKNSSADYHERVTRRIKQDAEITNELYKALAPTSRYAVPRIVACFLEDRVMVLEESDGQPLLNLIMKKGRGNPSAAALDELTGYCHDIGAWLKNFQNFTRVSMKQQVHRDNFMEYINIRLAKLESSPSFLRWANAESIRHAVKKILQDAPQDESFSCGVHSDLALSNILATLDKVTVLDFSMYKTGCRYNDPAYFYARLHNLLYQPFIKKYVIQILQESFLQGYESLNIANDSIFRAYYIRHKINYLVDLVRTNHLPIVKRYYQNYQFRRCLRDINALIRSC